MKCGLMTLGVYIAALLMISACAYWWPQQWDHAGLSTSCAAATITFGHHVIYLAINNHAVMPPAKSTESRSVRHRWKRCKYLSYLAFMLLLAGDIQLNPGPTTSVEIPSPDQAAWNTQTKPTKPVGSPNILHLKLQQRRDCLSIQTVNHAKILWNPCVKPTGLLGGHLNVRSIISKTDEIDKLLSDSNLDFFDLSKTWLMLNSRTLFTPYQDITFIDKTDRLEEAAAYFFILRTAFEALDMT